MYTAPSLSGFEPVQRLYRRPVTHLLRKGTLEAPLIAPLGVHSRNEGGFVCAFTGLRGQPEFGRGPSNSVYILIPRGRDCLLLPRKAVRQGLKDSYNSVFTWLLNHYLYPRHNPLDGGRPNQPIGCGLLSGAADSHGGPHDTHAINQIRRQNANEHDFE